MSHKYTIHYGKNTLKTSISSNIHVTKYKNCVTSHRFKYCKQEKYKIIKTNRILRKNLILFRVNHYFFPNAFQTLIYRRFHQIRPALHGASVWTSSHQSAKWRLCICREKPSLPDWSQEYQKPPTIQMNKMLCITHPLQVSFSDIEEHN